MKSSSMRRLTLVAATLLLLVPFGIISYVNYNASREWAREEIVTSALPLTRDTIYSEIHADMIQPIYVSSTMANDAFLKSWVAAGEADTEPVVRYLWDIHRKYGFFSVFFVSDATKRYYHYKGVHKVIRPDDPHDVWYYDFVKTGVEYRLEVDTNEADRNELTIFINFRVENEAGELMGVTGVGMKMANVAEHLRSTGRRFGRRLYLVDREGVVQAHPDPNLAGNTRLQDMQGLKRLAVDILAAKAQPADFTYGGPAGRVFLTSRYIPEFDWFLLVEQDERGALTSARLNFLRTVILGLALWVIVLAGLLWIAHRQQARLEQMARTDALTGLANRRQVDEHFQLASYRHGRSGQSFCLLLMDMDGFKKVNDTLGHLAGDALLRAVSDAIRAALRPTDLVARWGGDEFIVLAECSLEEGRQLGDRLREAVQAIGRRLANGDEDPRHNVSICCGVVPYHPGMSLDDMTHRADRMLYQCKADGGNCVLATPEG